MTTTSTTQVNHHIDLIFNHIKKIMVVAEVEADVVDEKCNMMN